MEQLNITGHLELEILKLKEEIFSLKEQLKPKPKGAAKKHFSKFWRKVEKDNCSIKTLASLAFDAGHALRHTQTEWVDVNDAMPKEYVMVLMSFKGNLSRIKGNVTEGWWNGEYWDCYALLIGVNEKIKVVKWMNLPNE